jgi:hypothetical protein
VRCARRGCTSQICCLCHDYSDPSQGFRTSHQADIRILRFAVSAIIILIPAKVSELRIKLTYAFCYVAHVVEMSDGQSTFVLNVSQAGNTCRAALCTKRHRARTRWSIITMTGLGPRKRQRTAFQHSSRCQICKCKDVRLHMCLQWRASRCTTNQRMWPIKWLACSGSLMDCTLRLKSSPGGSAAANREPRTALVYTGKDNTTQKLHYVAIGLFLTYRVFNGVDDAPHTAISTDIQGMVQTIRLCPIVLCVFFVERSLELELLCNFDFKLRCL